MHTALWVFIAAAIGLMLFATLQNDLPEELSFLKMPEDAVVVGAGPQRPGAAVRVSQHQGWEIQQTGSTLSATKNFRGSLQVNGNVFDTPQVGLLCHNNVLSLRLDTRLATTGTARTPIVIGAAESAWDKGAAGMNVLAPDSKKVLRALLSAQGPVRVGVSYRDLGVQFSELDPVGLADISAAMTEGCRP